MYEFGCTYLCGNRVINKDVVDPLKSERCDIGEWGFGKLDNAGYYTNADLSVSITKTAAFKWVDDKSDPKITSTLGLGCTSDCYPYEGPMLNDDGSPSNNYVHFKYDPDNYSNKGTDRCGDGFMDGPIPLTFNGDGTPASYIRSTDFSTMV